MFLTVLQYGAVAAAVGGISFAAYNRLRPLAEAQSSDLESLRRLIDENKVLVLSKTYCPYCSRTKALLTDLRAMGVQVVELDARSDGEGLQSAALTLTGQRTVPNVFIGGKHVGGNDKMQELHRKGGLVPLLKAVGSV